VTTGVDDTTGDLAGADFATDSNGASTVIGGDGVLTVYYPVGWNEKPPV